MEQKSYNLFLDDERFPKDVKWIELPLVEWIIGRSYNDFVDIIHRLGVPARVSFDHDLADEHYKEYLAAHDPLIIDRRIRYETFKEKTGYECAKWLANYCVDKQVPLPVYYVHTMNDLGKLNIISVMESARKVMSK